MRLTEEQYEALQNRSTGKQHNNSSKKSSKKTVITGGGYTANWAGWAEVGGVRCYFRSLWEHNYACYLEFLKGKGAVSKWEHEPRRFSFKDKYKRPPYDYLPDFCVSYPDGTKQWHEVKGYLNGTSRSKIKRFEKHFPRQGRILLIDKTWFKDSRKYAALIPGWLGLDQAIAKYPQGR